MHKEKHIVIVDDAESIRSFLGIILESEGYVTHEAATAAEGFAALHELRVDMLTLDLGLPDMDGLAMLKQVKREYPELPVVVISVRNDGASQKAAQALGAEHYLTKPFEAYDVLEIVHDTLS